MTKASDVTGGIFFAFANVEAIERAVTLRLKCHCFVGTEVPNAGTIGNFTGIGFRALEQADIATPGSAMLEMLVRECPIDRPVSQRHHLVLNTGVDQRLG